MEASDGVVRGNVDSLMKLVDALAAAGIELIGEGATSERRRPRRAAQGTPRAHDARRVRGSDGRRALLLLALAAPVALRSRASPHGTRHRLWREPDRHARPCASSRCSACSSRPPRHRRDAAARPAVARRAFPHRRARRVLPGRGQSRRRGASLFALGYGRHEHAPQRVLPFYPAFLAGMNLVVLADDAFSFLVAWEFMSLTSWALVMAHHRDARERARRLRLSADGELRHAGAAARLRPARRRRRRLRLRRDARRASVRRARRRWC